MSYYKKINVKKNIQIKIDVHGAKHDFNKRYLRCPIIRNFPKIWPRNFASPDFTEKFKLRVSFEFALLNDFLIEEMAGNSKLKLSLKQK